MRKYQLIKFKFYIQDVIISLIYSIMGNRVDYSCPSCGSEVWAYSMWAGNVCWDCPGTIAHGIVKGTPLRIAQTIVTAATNTKTHYKCPRCNQDVWAYGQFAGQTCWDCKIQQPLNMLEIVGQVGISVAPLTPLAPPIAQTGVIALSAHTAVNRVGGTFLQMTKINKIVKDNIGEVYQQDLVKSVEIRSCWISHQIVTGPLSTLTHLLQGKLIRHWWVVIETTEENWYWAELNINGMSLQRFDEYGKMSGNCKDGISLQEKKATVKNSSRSMASVEKWVRDSNHKYDLQYHNCQDWAKEFYEWVK